MRAHMSAQKASGQPTMAPTAAAQNGAAAAATSTPAQVTEQDLAYMSDLEASYLLAGKRRAKKVAAMNALAQRKITPSVRIIVPHLVDADPMIAAAAMTALTDMGTGLGGTPLEHVHRDLVAAIETGENPVKVKAAEVLMKLGPKRSPLKERLEKLAGKPDLNVAAKSIVARLLGVPPPAPSRAIAATELDPQKLGAAAKFMPKSAGKAGTIITDLDKKRAYMQARQEWIRGGKRGPEPPPPTE
jgi:hypothetical protein